jgi:hypothetical protein
MRFIPGFADIAKPLTRLAEKKRTFDWSPEAEATFRSLKEALCTAPVLLPATGRAVHCRHGRRQHWDSGVLSQVQDSHERVVAYFSKTVRLQLLRDPTRLTGHCEDIGAFPQLPVWTRVSPAYDHCALTWLLIASGTWRGRQLVMFSVCRSTILHLSIIRGGNTNAEALSKNHVQRNSPTVGKSNGQTAWRYEELLLLMVESAQPWGGSSWLLSTWAATAGSRGWITPWVGRHLRREPRLRKLLGPVEGTSSTGRHTGASLGVGWWENKDGLVSHFPW